MKILDNLNIKQIVKLGVFIISLAMIFFGISIFYLLNILKEDQVTIKEVIDLEIHNKQVINTIKELDIINSKILLSKKLEDIENIEILDFERISHEEDELFKDHKNLDLKYHKNIDNINILLEKQFQIQAFIYQKSTLILFYKEEINKDILNINNKIRRIIKITNNISGKVSLSNKRIKREIKKEFTQNELISNKTITNIEKVFSLNNEKTLTLTNQMDKGILRLENLPKEILFARDIDELNDIKTNKLFQAIRHFDNTLHLLKQVHKEDIKALDKITLDFLEIKDINTFILNSRELMFSLDEELNVLREQREIINKEVYSKNNKLISIAEDIQLDIIKNSEQVIKESTLMVFIISAIFIILIYIAAKTLIYRINLPLNTIISFIKNFSSLDKDSLSKKLPVINDDEFAQLSKVFNILTDTISTNINKIEKLNEGLEKRVIERTQELEDANDELETSIYNLKQTQEKLVESEKMASLGTLVAGVAHEINTPVGIGLTGASHFLDLTKSIKKDYEEDDMTQASFENYLNKANDLAVIVNSNLHKTAELVRSFKQIAVDQTSEKSRIINIKEYLEQVIHSLGNINRKLDLSIEVTADDSLKINTYPGAISQIFSNLIINSIRHGFKGYKEGNIQIEIKQIENQIEFKYIDNGKGIETKNINKIYEPFFTTNREDGGSGLGLNIIYNIITKNLKGTINCTSTVNKGVDFTIKIPIKKV